MLVWEDLNFVIDASLRHRVEENQVSKIFILAVVMYGCIAGLWILYFTNRSRLPADKLYIFRLALLIVSFCSTSIGMQVLNKSVVGMLRAPALVAVVQMLIAVFCMGLVALRQMGPVTAAALGRWMIVPLFFAAMLCTSAYTFSYISLSLMTVVRNLTPFIALPVEYITMPPEKKPAISCKLVSALILTLVGTLIYAGGLQGLSWAGIIFAVANMTLAVCDRVIQRTLLTGSCKEIPSSVCTVVNNSFGMMPTLVVALATHQVQNLSRHDYYHAWQHPQTIILLVLSGLVGIGICFLGFECQREISATSFFVMQNVAKVAVVVVGVLIFHDPIRSWASVLGLVLSIGGSFWYGWVSMNAPKKPEETPLVSSKEKMIKP